MKQRRNVLECPCCGDDGAVSDADGQFFDGQGVICGCDGWVSIEEDGTAWVNVGDNPCRQCQEDDDEPAE